MFEMNSFKVWLSIHQVQQDKISAAQEMTQWKRMITEHIA